LFRERGFDQTTVDDVAAAGGIGRRTLFRYFPSKNDLPWGDFEAELARMRSCLHETPPDVPLTEALCNAVLAFNDFPPDEVPFRRERMRLLFTVPALVAHSTLRYASWRQVIAEFVGKRLGVPASSHEPQTIAWIFLGASLAAWEQWLVEEDSDLLELFATSFDTLRNTLTATDG
jgi:mycofactocin system transcriptional regulator